MKYCETIIAGFYYIEDPDSKRCYFLTGTLKGNKWIDLTDHEPQWMALMWTAIQPDIMQSVSYRKTNPTDYIL